LPQKAPPRLPEYNKLMPVSQNNGPQGRHHDSGLGATMALNAQA
jgi:hypothetical protein